MKGFALSPEIPNEHMTILKLDFCSQHWTILVWCKRAKHLSYRMSAAWRVILLILQLCYLKFAHSGATRAFFDDSWFKWYLLVANCAGYSPFTSPHMQVHSPPLFFVLSSVLWEADPEFRGKRRERPGCFLPASSLLLCLIYKNVSL